jgi:hypothetical protein
MRNEEVLRRVKEERRILQIIIGHVLVRNCLLKHIIEGKIQGRTEAIER